MEELKEIRKAVKPHNVLLVVDAMTGQDAVNVAEQFAEAVNFDGVIMTKLDGDARGGAALSIKAVTGKPIMFASMGEKLDQFELFHPDRMAQRILGMGDVLTLIEKAESQIDEDEALELERKLRKNEFTFDDFLSQMKMMRKMGSLSSLLGMIPGFQGSQLKNMNIDDRELDRMQAIILSMTPEERRQPEIINGTRRLRIAKGSGTSVQQVNQLVKQFGEMQKMMKQLGRGKMPDLQALMRQALGTSTEGRNRGATLFRPMAVRLRLTRVGGRKNPIWRVVVADQRSPRDGRVIETIGTTTRRRTRRSSRSTRSARSTGWIAARSRRRRSSTCSASSHGRRPRPRHDRRRRRVPRPVARRHRDAGRRPHEGVGRLVRGGRHHRRPRAFRRR